MEGEGLSILEASADRALGSLLAALQTSLPLESAATPVGIAAQEAARRADATEAFFNEFGRCCGVVAAKVVECGPYTPKPQREDYLVY